MESRAFVIAALTVGAWSAEALAWGQEGHSIIAEVAQHRLTPAASAEVARLLGSGRSLASATSWADDVRDERPETYNRHFVDIPLAEERYDPARDCKPTEKGDCIVAALERLKKDFQCAPSDDQKRDALRFVVHFVGDIHQPLHTVSEARGGNDIPIEVRLAGAKTCKGGGPCPIHPYRSNFHAVWDRRADPGDDLELGRLRRSAGRWLAEVPRRPTWRWRNAGSMGRADACRSSAHMGATVGQSRRR